MINDRRRTERDRRLLSRIPAVFAVKSVIGPAVHLGQSQDLGPTGMSLYRPGGIPLSTGMSVQLWFSLPGDGLEISAIGVVVNDRRLGRLRRTGVKFTNIAPAIQDRIRAFCATQPRPAWNADEGIAASPI